MGRSTIIAAAAAAAIMMTITAADALSFPEGTETSTVSIDSFEQLSNGACTMTHPTRLSPCFFRLGMQPIVDEEFR